MEKCSKGHAENTLERDREHQPQQWIKSISNMADPQFEQFRDVFDKLPQHIKAPSYCYRLADDILLDGVLSDDDEDEMMKQDSMIDVNNPPNNVLTNEHSEGIFCTKNNGICLDFSTQNSNTTIFQNENWNERCFQDSLHKPLWTNGCASSTQNGHPQQQLCQPSGRKRRRLPEIPKDKPALSTSIVFKTRALSLAEEINEAEKNSQAVSTISPKVPDDASIFMKPKRHQRRLFPFRKCPRFADDDSSPEDKIFHTDIDSGNSTAHSPDGAKSFSPAVNGSCSPSSPVSSSGISTTTLESLEATHRGLHKFIPRHHDEVEIEIGDPLYVQREADDLWCEGFNLRTGKSGIFPSAYATDVEYTDFDPDSIKMKKERFILKFLGSIEVTCNKGNEVLCQAIRKITRTKEGEGMHPHPCVLEIGDQGLWMVDKSKPLPNEVPCHDYFFCLKNISFCGFHPQDYRYFGFITKHPTQQRFACHVFIGEDSTRPVAEAVGRAFQRFYEKFIETAYPIEDIYIE